MLKMCKKKKQVLCLRVDRNKHKSKYKPGKGNVQQPENIKNWKLFE